MRINKLLSSLCLLAPLALTGCPKDGDKADPAKELEFNAKVLGLILSDAKPDEIEKVLGEAIPTRTGNEHVFGTCETPKDDVDPEYDIQYMYSFSTFNIDTTSALMTQCGQVDDAFVACSPEGSAYEEGEEFFVSSFTLGARLDYTRPDMQWQLSMPYLMAERTQWQAIDAYPCDYWRYFTTFPYVSLSTDAFGMTFGDFRLSETLNDTIGELPTSGRAIIEGPSITFVVPKKDLGEKPIRYGAGIDGRFFGTIELEYWDGGDVEPSVEDADPQEPGNPFGPLRF